PASFPFHPASIPLSTRFRPGFIPVFTRFLPAFGPSRIDNLRPRRPLAFRRKLFSPSRPSCPLRRTNPPTPIKPTQNPSGASKTPVLGSKPLNFFDETNPQSLQTSRRL